MSAASDRQDAVSGGMHCFIGGRPHDLLKTSTLGTHFIKSFSIPLGVDWLLKEKQVSKFGENVVPFISFGDGSLFTTNVPEGFYLSRWLTESNLGLRHPSVVLITDNTYSISLNTRRFASDVWPSVLSL